MQKYYFSSDQHLGHKRIFTKPNGLRFKPFSNIDDYTEWYINLHNSIVSQNDLVYFLGDFSFYNRKKTEDILKKLNGRIHFIYGNHDRKISEGVESTGTLRTLSFNKEKITLCHYPMRTWYKSHRDYKMLHGHEHGKITPLKNSIDVGFNIYGKLLELNEIIRIIQFSNNILDNGFVGTNYEMATKYLEEKNGFV